MAGNAQKEKMGIKELDEALAFLYPKYQTYYNHESLKKECFNNSDIIDVEAIIIKLREDGFLHYDLNGQNKNDFKLSIAGRLAHETGGYKGERERKAKAATLQSWQTWAIAGGTVAAGVYGLVELLRTLFCR